MHPRRKVSCWAWQRRRSSGCRRRHGDRRRTGSIGAWASMAVGGVAQRPHRVLHAARRSDPHGPAGAGSPTRARVCQVRQIVDQHACVAERVDEGARLAFDETRRVGLRAGSRRSSCCSRGATHPAANACAVVGVEGCVVDAPSSVKPAVASTLTSVAPNRRSDARVQPRERDRKDAFEKVNACAGS